MCKPKLVLETQYDAKFYSLQKEILTTSVSY